MPIVNVTRPRPNFEGVQNGSAVRGADWGEAAALTNWLAGQGRQVVPCMTPGTGTYTWAGTTTSGDNDPFRWRFRFLLQPTYQSVERLWTVHGECDDPFGVKVGSGAETFPGAALHAVSERIASQTSAETDVALEFSPTEDLEIFSIGCWELPRAVLSTSANELGAAVSRLQKGQPIEVSALQRIRQAALATQLGKRTLFHWATAYETDDGTTTTTTTAHAISTTSSTFAGMFGVSVPMLARQIFNGDTTASVSAKVYAWVSGGGSGEVRLTSDKHGQVSNTVTISNTSPAWSSVMSGQTLDAEEFGTIDGLRSGAWDGINFEFRATSGTLFVTSATAFET